MVEQQKDGAICTTVILAILLHPAQLQIWETAGKLPAEYVAVIL